MLLQAFLFAAGLAGLIYGAEWLIAGSASLARRIGVSQLVIGLTVVAIGTSSPEMAVSVFAALAGNTDVALGNIVGSNIANLGLILGASALLAPIPVEKRIVAQDIPIMIGAAVLLAVFAIDGEINRLDGLVLLLGTAAYFALMFRVTRKQPQIAREEIEIFNPPEERPSGLTRNILFIVFGLTLLVAGARLLVGSATFFARAMGVSDLVIGLTVVAVGTSLPELATSMLAAWRGHSQLALGNVIGSNIFNILLVLGATAVTRPLPATPEMLAFEIPIMVAVSVLLLPLAIRGASLVRWEGALFVAAYIAFVALLLGRGTL